MSNGYIASSESMKPLTDAQMSRIKSSQRKSVWNLSYPHKTEQQPLLTEQSGTRREQVTNTTEGPFSSICQIMVFSPSGEQFFGSGWIVGRRTVITAGHVVYARESGWMTGITVWPGVNGHGFVPAQFSGSAWNTTDQFRTSTFADAVGAEPYDYGVIQIDGDFTGTAEPLEFNSFSAADLTERTASVIGYPTSEPWGTQWGSTDQVIAVENGQLRYNIVTSPGDSGSPVYADFRQVIGIHNYGDTDYNLGTWISPDVASQIRQWISQYD